MEADAIDDFVASLNSKQKDQLWEIVQNWNEAAIYASQEIADEMENPTVATVLESALDNS